MRIFDAGWGHDITDTIERAIASAAERGDQCQFEFNGVTVNAAGDSNPLLLYRDWNRGMKGYLGKNPTVGPHPAEVLLGIELASDAEIESSNEARRREQAAKYDAESKEKRERLQTLLAKSPAMEVANQQLWDQCRANNTDGYGARIVRYAEEWARLMQLRLADMDTIADCAKPTSAMADDDGITGFMYGAAVAMLSEVWVHGDELRRWHNLDTQIGTEGEKANAEGRVLNPALLSIG